MADNFTTATRPLNVNDSFLKLLPVLGDEERKLLKEQIEDTGGPVEPITVWSGKDVIVDGHNRYSICEETGLPFQVREVEFTDEAEVRLWMIRHQLGRRNLTRNEFTNFLGQLYAARKGKPTEDGKTAAEAVAEETGVNEKTVRRAADYAKGVEVLSEVAPEEATKALKGKSALKQGDVEKIGKSAAKGKKATADSVKNMTTMAEKAKKVKAKKPAPAKAEASGAETPAPKVEAPAKSYDVIVATPYIWEGIEKIKVPASPDAVMFLRTPKEYYPEAMDALKKWGFRVVDEIVHMHKSTSSVGDWSRCRHTSILVATKGEPMMPAPTERPASVIEADGHAGIPPVILEAIAKATKGLTGRLLMFSSANADGFDAWDLPSTDEDEAPAKASAPKKAPAKKAPPKKTAA